MQSQVLRCSLNDFYRLDWDAVADELERAPRPEASSLAQVVDWACHAGRAHGCARSHVLVLSGYVLAWPSGRRCALHFMCAAGIMAVSPHVPSSLGTRMLLLLAAYAPELLGITRIVCSLCCKRLGM